MAFSDLVAQTCFEKSSAFYSSRSSVIPGGMRSDSIPMGLDRRSFNGPSAREHMAIWRDLDLFKLLDDPLAWGEFASPPEKTWGSNLFAVKNTIDLIVERANLHSCGLANSEQGEFVLVLSPPDAIRLSKTEEFKTYIKSDLITLRDPSKINMANEPYGLLDRMYGVRILVSNGCYMSGEQALWIKKPGQAAMVYRSVIAPKPGELNLSTVTKHRMSEAFREGDTWIDEYVFDLSSPMTGGLITNLWGD